MNSGGLGEKWLCAAARSAGSRVGDRVSDMNVYAGMRDGARSSAPASNAVPHNHRATCGCTCVIITHTPHGMCVMTTRRAIHTIVDGLVADVAFLAF
jgi:hypothetical protein